MHSSSSGLKPRVFRRESLRKKGTAMRRTIATATSFVLRRRLMRAKEVASIASTPPSPNEAGVSRERYGAIGASSSFGDDESRRSANLPP
jgi:hypothetical protein